MSWKVHLFPEVEQGTIFPAGVQVFPTGILQIPQGICLNAIVCVVINISIFSQELFDKKRIPAESRQEKKTLSYTFANI